MPKFIVNATFRNAFGNSKFEQFVLEAKNSDDAMEKVRQKIYTNPKMHYHAGLALTVRKAVSLKRKS